MIDLRSSTEAEVVLAGRVLARFDVVARAVGVEYLVVGAMARTLLSIGVIGRPPERLTRDIDIAVAVSSWDDFERLGNMLDKRGRSPHAFLVDEVEVDVVPYGSIEHEDRTIVWPDEHRMNVRGLSEAVSSAETVLLPGGLATRVPSIPALALLKLLTWWDRRADTNRDAIDLATMIGWYSSEAFLTRLYEEEIDVLAQHDFDPVAAGAWLLGADMPGLLDPSGVAALLRIAEDMDALARLASDTRVRSPRGSVLVETMAAGIRDSAARRGAGGDLGPR